MLRRTEKIIFRDEVDTEEKPAPRSASERRGLGSLRPAPSSAPAEDPEPAKPVVEERNHDRWRNEVEPLPQLSPEQRRDIDRWRTEVLRSVSAIDDDDAPSSRWRHLLKPTNIALLAVALLAGGAAAYLALQQQPSVPATEPAAIVAAAPEPQTITQIVEEPKVQVLVARTPISVGQRLTPATIEWVEWPEDTTRADFVTQTTAPDAIEDMSGAVARYEFFPGEPIREVKLARADRGFLSAVLDPGTRGVSVNVSAESAAGGFILPNDRVDVVLTSSIGSKQVSTTILDNVRVLAINSQIGETAATRAKSDKPRNSGASDDPGSEEDAGPVTFASAIATLALDPRQAEVIISATLNGRLSLVLRPTADVAEASEDAAVRARNEAIRISSPFWTN